MMFDHFVLQNKAVFFFLRHDSFIYHCKHHQDLTASESLVGDDDEATKRENFFLTRKSLTKLPILLSTQWVVIQHTYPTMQRLFPWLQCSLRMTGETQLHTFWWVWEAGATAAAWLDDVGITKKSWKKVATLGRVRDCHFHCACQSSLLQ
jgi:hypothetical protein